MRLSYVPVFILMLMVAACSKKADPGIVTPKETTHTIRIKIIADADFSVTVTARKAEDNIRTVIEDKATTMGAYEIITTQVQGSFIYAEVKPATATQISYTIYNDDKVVAQQINQAVSARVNIEYEVR